MSIAQCQDDAPEPGPASRNASWRVTCSRLCLLIALLLVHFLSRQRAAQVLPLSGRTFYAHDYSVALSMLAGHGFNYLTVNPSLDDLPVAQFLDLKRPELSAQEFDEYCRSPNAGARRGTTQASTRILELRLAAILWKIFGIKWSVLFTFYALVSTACCLLIFLMARQLSGNFWLALFAGLLYFASPLEHTYSVLSIRDISPLWFTTLSFWIFVCLVERSSYRIRNHVMSACLGGASMIGYGWRSDALLLAPFFAVAMPALLVSLRRSWLYILSMTTALVGGILFAWGLIQWAGPQEVRPAGWGFHIAYYGNLPRLEMFRLEDSFQIARDDSITQAHACYRHEVQSGPGQQLRYLGPEYGAICRGMYLDTMRYNLFRWVAFFPEFYERAVRFFPSNAAYVQAEPLALVRTLRLRGMALFYRYGLDYLTRSAPFLFFIGVFMVWSFDQERVRACVLVAFSIYYAAALLAVLPETKHLAPLLVPVIVIASVWPAFWPRLRQVSWDTVRSGLLAIVGLLLLYGSACAVTYPYSLSWRDHYLRDIMDAARSGVDAADTIKGPQRFEACRTNDRQHAGFLLTIRTGATPGLLVCTHRRDTRNHLKSCVATQHRLHPDREQYFFVSCIDMARYGMFASGYVCEVSVGQEAEIVSSTKVDLSCWRQLPLSTVFYQGERSPGSPHLGKTDMMAAP